MSSFITPHFFYLFEMTTGKKKLGYGQNPADAYEGLKLRLTPQEMTAVKPEAPLKITQKEIRDYIDQLG